MKKLKYLCNSCKDIFDSSHNGIVIMDDSGYIVFYNRSAGRLLNRSPDEMDGTFIGDVLPQSWPDIKIILATGKPQIGKKIVIGDFIIIANRSPIIQNNRVIGVISIFQDISEYEKMLTELESYSRITEKLDAIIDSSFDGLWICDNEGRVIRINLASEKINAVRGDQVIGKKMEDLIGEGLIDRSVTLEVLKNQTAVTLIQKLKNGKQILVTGNPVFNAQGEVRLVVVNERDITELNRLRSELEETQALAHQYRSELSHFHIHQHLLSKIIIRSESMHRVFETTMKVAQVDSTVLIQGESGVGKGLFAKLIHQASHRKEGPFIRVDCGAIPESLIESELFGYEKGAFTGAQTEGKPGHFELANKGTLFLDEVGELPVNMQVKLLRFSEENKVVRVGGITPRTINVRIIAATHRNLADMVQHGEFRKDLFFRLNVVPLRIPPLRERLDDIPLLVEYFLNNLNEQYSKSKRILSPAIDCLCRYGFPGNIRELSNLVEQLVVLTQDDRIALEDLPTHVRWEKFEGLSRPPESEWNLSKAVTEMEKKMIIRALKVFGTQRKAAGPLGIDQSTLARKAKRLGIRIDVIVHHDE